MGNTIFTSETAQVIISIIPIVGIAIGGIVVFFYILWHHHEVKLRITNGNYKTRPFDLQTFSLLTGLLLTAIGFMLTLLFAIVEKGFSYVLLGGLIPLAIGVSLLIFYKVNPAFKVKDDKSEN
ncbi:MAG: hypothetical protein MJ184_04830 [Treponema sp.]|uniref:hypothetical protein n=1 Tax=Treponema sp. TaxID=166 RepID=UPI001D4F7A48|nr:hypothetical protein [Treponema sp.]MCI5696167.1 hypothetical protein [Spirochaetia bacterium]MBS7310233.1 hypothetical protein [Treponema sp.]MCQ2600667.1 hypothetical protein [Treponema sp.]MDD5810646.1 hypothetical protein [Treponema sp.]MDY5885941.1 hypothetical protein [Treponema sp.]